ncbi:MAG TPA: CHASE2 domain-containing protein [Caulobacteraceae bacterium]|jgi:CHASE2 domain-containing sensor protein|nr:CHASE2 domain-containing protein [Caulobacteraceae bacterium]
MAERQRTAISFTIGLIVLLLIQIPAVEQSFLGGPDREMMETAFKLRTDVTGGTAEPVLFLDFDDRTLGTFSSAPFAAPPTTTPRAIVAELLDFIRATPPPVTPRVVVLDVDIGQTTYPDDPGVKALLDALTHWAATPTAPPLIIVRQAYQAASLGAPGRGLALPDTPYDSVVDPASNIFWSTEKVLGDQNGVIREFLPFECVSRKSGVIPLYSAALLAYQFAERDQHVLDTAPARHWIPDGAAHCQSQPDVPLTRGERIDYHISLGSTFAERVWPNLSSRWPGFKVCGSSDTAIFRRLSVIDIHNAIIGGGDISRELLCQHVVIIGGTSGIAGDFVQTPLSEMNGSVVLANAIRGLELSHGGLRAIPLIIQVFLLMFVSLAMSAAAVATKQARDRYRLLRRGRHKARLTQRLGVIGLNPIIVNGIIALSAHLAGIALLTVSLNFGLWGFVSAPAFAAAITETVQEFF